MRCGAQEGSQWEQPPDVVEAVGDWTEVGGVVSLSRCRVDNTLAPRAEHSKALCLPVQQCNGVRWQWRRWGEECGGGWVCWLMGVRGGRW